MKELKKKIEVYSPSDSKEVKSFLSGIMPVRFVPTFLGGECQIQFPGGGPAKDFGKDIPMNIGQVRRVTMARNAVYDHVFETKDSVSITWEFTSEHPVKFGLYYKPNTEEKKKTILQKPEVYPSKQKVQGQFDAKDKGIYYVAFRNDSLLVETGLTYHLSW